MLLHIQKVPVPFVLVGGCPKINALGPESPPSAEQIWYVLDNISAHIIRHHPVAQESNTMAAMQETAKSLKAATGTSPTV